ncbi:exo-alpha-sialidase [Longitalea luteola]|uniref:exo-alpha-sialidase n=1 Tax=Longitalea luteola TaxID=2812563 RepID=UPI001A96733A|nr:exo-alpha-sialidase [Longitalea luteola]
MNKIPVLGALLMCGMQSAAQDTVRYVGTTLSNVDYHHGQLSLAIGVHNIQTMRANRNIKDSTTGFGWTYNHAPMLTYWNNTFFMEYLSNPVGEHIPPGQSLLQTSKDGYTWTAPVIVFPEYKIPDGTTKEGYNGVAKDLTSVMHQRMGFYISNKGRLLAFAYYGLVLGPKDDPNDGNGIGRVVREIYKDGSFGPIYFIRYNHAFNARNTSYPFFEKSKDKGFVEACKEVLSNTLLLQQWSEEADRKDPLIALKNENYKAFSYYELPDGRTVGLWKLALTSISPDKGKTWLYNPVRAPHFVNSNAKIWGQRTSDGKYITVYNPSEFRWPLALSVSDDGLNYKNLLLVNGEITSMRYGGNYKSYGPQYVRGLEGGAKSPDGNCWITYSMNKEDIWVSKIPIPVKDKVETDVNDDFTKLPAASALKEWNIYSPLWAPVAIEKAPDGTQALAIKDKDPFDYGKAEHVLPAAKKMTATFTVVPQQDDHGNLNVEFQDAKGNAGIRLVLDSTGNIYVKAGYRNRNIGKYKKGESCEISISLNTSARFYTVSVNGRQSGNQIFFAPLENVQRLVFRTGDVRRFPDADTPTDQMYDLPNAGAQTKEAVWYIKSVKTKSLN